MEGVERTNTVIVRSNQRVGLAQRNPYAIEVNREVGTATTMGNLGIWQGITGIGE